MITSVTSLRWAAHLVRRTTRGVRVCIGARFATAIPGRPRRSIYTYMKGKPPRTHRALVLRHRGSIDPPAVYRPIRSTMRGEGKGEGLSRDRSKSIRGRIPTRRADKSSTTPTATSPRRRRGIESVSGGRVGCRLARVCTLPGFLQLFARQ